MSFGDPSDSEATEFQEDCAGTALLSHGVRLWKFRVQCRDVLRLSIRTWPCFRDAFDLALVIAILMVSLLPEHVSLLRSYTILGSTFFLELVF